MKLLYHRELLFQEVLNNVPHRHVVWQSDFVTDGDELSSTKNKRRYPFYYSFTRLPVKQEYLLKEPEV